MEIEVWRVPRPNTQPEGLIWGGEGDLTWRTTIYQV